MADLNIYDGVKPHHSHVVEKIYNSLKDAHEIVKDGKIAGDELITLGTEAMILVDGYRDIRGMEKKAVVLAVANLTVAELKLTKRNKSIANHIIKNVLPPTVDIVIAASRGEFNLNKKWKKLKALFRPCCSSPADEHPEEKVKAVVSTNQ